MRKNPLSAYSPQGIFYTFISVPSLKVKRTSSLLKTVTKSTRLYHCSSSNSVAMPSCRSSSARNLSICSFFACFSVMALPTSSSRAFVRSNRSASRHTSPGIPSGRGRHGRSHLRTVVSVPPPHSVLPEAATVPFPAPPY